MASAEAALGRRAHSGLLGVGVRSSRGGASINWQPNEAVHPRPGRRTISNSAMIRPVGIEINYFQTSCAAARPPPKMTPFLPLAIRHPRADSSVPILIFPRGFVPRIIGGISSNNDDHMDVALPFFNKSSGWVALRILRSPPG